MYRNFYARKKYRLDDFGQYQHVVVYKLYDLVWPNSSCYRNSNVSGSFFYGRPLSVSGRPCYILPMFFLKLINLFFYGRLILRPWWTEVRESFTRGGPWVPLKKLLLGLFPGHRENTGWAKKWRNLAYFQTPPANFLLSRPNAAEYCNSEKKTC